MSENEPTEKQKIAFYNMQLALGWNSPMPETKRAMSIKISEMSAEINKRITHFGAIRPKEGVHF